MFRVLGFLMVLSFMGCATTYQPRGFSGGYTETQLNKDLFEVSFSGNGFTSYSTVSDMFLRRCAEITKENGYSHFVLVNQDSGSTTQTVSSQQSGTISPNYYGGYNYTANTSNFNVTKSYRDGTIKLFKEENKPETAISADIILKNYLR